MMDKNLILISFDYNCLWSWMVYAERNQKFIFLIKCSFLFLQKIYDLLFTNIELFSIKLEMYEQ
jgi:hypothetical protein